MKEIKPREDGLFAVGEMVTSNGKYPNIHAEFNGAECGVIATRDAKGYHYAGEQFVTIRLNGKEQTLYANGLKRCNGY